MNNKEVLGLNKITKTRLKELCKKHKLYQTPHLNDQLYLHYQGFQAIENLDEYTGLKCLWLESNAISEIQGLDCQRELKCLFLQNNLIKKIENLQSCLVLDTLNLASNHITRVENCGVDVLPVLSTLNLSRNYLRNSDGLRELVNCSNLWSLDLSHNRIDDILVVKIFANMPELRVLVLQGNPVVSQVPQYRKTLILECKNLTYLDSRPVFPKDRACAEAWKRGGYEEERRENERWVREDRKKIRDSVNATLRLRQKQGGGDVQLLESTDDEDENSKPKPEEIVNADLEITGVDEAIKHEDIKPEVELKISESSLSKSSDSEVSVLKSADGLDESIVGIQMPPNQGYTAIEDKSSNIQSRYLDEQMEEPFETYEEKDLVISGKAPMHDEEDRLQIEPTASGEATQSVAYENTNKFISDNEDCLSKPSTPNSVAMRSANGFSEQATIWKESLTLTSDPSLTSDSSSNGTGMSDDADTMDIFDNIDNSSEDMLSKKRPKDFNLKQECKEEEDSEEDKNNFTDFAELTEKLSYNISSESQFGDSELSLPSITEEEEADLQNLDQTFEIDTKHSTFSVPVSPSPTLETDRNLSEFEDSNGENMQTVSEVEDSACFNIFNSFDVSKRMYALQRVLSNQPLDEEQNDSKMSVWHDMILTDLVENKAIEDKNKTTDNSPQSSKANTLSSSLFVENSDEESTPRKTLDDFDASTWLDLGLETYNQEPFMETIEEEVLSEKTERSTSTEADGEKSLFENSYQSDGSSLLEYILKISTEPEYDKSLTEICMEEIEVKNQILHEEPKSPPEELNCWLEKDESKAFHGKVSLQDLLATFEKEEKELLPSDEFNKRRMQLEDDDEDEDLVEKQEYIYTKSVDDDEESLSSMYNKDKTFAEDEMLQNFLKKIKEEEPFSVEKANKDSENIEDWLGEAKDNSFGVTSHGSGLQDSAKVKDDDEDENLVEKLEYIYTKSIDNDEESLSSMYDKDLGLNEDNAFEEDDMLQNFLKKIEGEEPFSLETANEDSENIEDWLGEAKDKSFGGISDRSGMQGLAKVENDDEDENLVEKQEYIYTKSIDNDEESLSSMYDKDLGLNEDKVFEEDDMLQNFLKKIEGEEPFSLETANKDAENIEDWLGEDGSGLQNSFSCSRPYEEVFDNKHFSLVSEARLKGRNMSKKVAELTQVDLLKNSSEASVLTRSHPGDRTATLGQVDSGPAMTGDSWWEKTLAAARESTDPPREPTNDENFAETISQTQVLEEDGEASALLEHILTKTHKNEVEINPNQTEAAELPSNDANDESKQPTTIRDVLSSFNKVAENITTTRYLYTYARTRDFYIQSSDQINRQVEEMNREQRARVSQMIDQVYAQSYKYDDNLEVLDGRLMVVKRSTGALEELPLPPTSSSKYIQANCNDSDSDDDYGTALSEDEPDDDGDIEQHASDTKIKKIPYLSAIYGNESLSSTGLELDEAEDNCRRENNEQTIDFKHKVMGLCNEGDAVACMEWMEKGAASPAGWVSTEKGNGGEKASPMEKLCCGTTDVSCRRCKQMDFDEAALQDTSSFDF